MKLRIFAKSVLGAFLAGVLVVPALFAQPAQPEPGAPAKTAVVLGKATTGQSPGPKAKGGSVDGKLARRAEFSRQTSPGRAALTVPVGTPVAHLQKIEGDVLVSAESGLVAAERGALLRQGQSVITMVKSSAVVRFIDGCEITLKPNHRYEVSLMPPCDERIDYAESTLIDLADLEAALEGSTASIPAMALSGAFPTGAIAGSSGLAGLGALAAASAQDTASPN